MAKPENKGEPKGKGKKGKDGAKAKGKGDGAQNKLSEEEKQKRLKNNPPQPEGVWPDTLTFNGLKNKYELCKVCLDGKECKEHDPNKKTGFIKSKDHWKPHELQAEVRRRQWQNHDSRQKQ